MQTLFPPDYPCRPDAPLLSFGPSFAEELSRSVINAVWRPDEEQPHETDVRVSAALTMLEAFHPRDHLECMQAAQGVAGHAMIMECYRRAMHPDTPEPVAIKLRANVAQLSRTFSLLTHDLERRQAKPLPPRPPEGGAAPAAQVEGPPPPPPASRKTRAKAPVVSPAVISPEPAIVPAVVRPPDDLPRLEDLPGEPEDLTTRPDGTPGSLSAYAPKPPEEVFVPDEPAIMLALASRPKPWRMVNSPPETPGAAAPVLEPGPVTRGPLDMNERMFTGDSLARFTSARFDPHAPVDLPRFEDDGAMVELELISTGGDPEMEAERAAMTAANPEGKPVVTIRYGRQTAPEDSGPEDW